MSNIVTRISSYHAQIFDMNSSSKYNSAKWSNIVLVFICGCLLYLLVAYSYSLYQEMQRFKDTSQDVVLVMEKLNKLCPKYRTLVNELQDLPPCPKKEEFIHLQEMTKFLEGSDETREAVFLTDTSGTGSIRPRFMCAVESAARAYKHGDIYLLIANVSPDIRIDQNEALYKILKHYPNVHALRVDMDLLFKNTPLETFHKNRILNQSPAAYLKTHIADVIRMTTIWRYGGKYFDMDFINIKNVTEKNFVIPDDAPVEDPRICTGIFGFQKKFPVMDILLKHIANDKDRSWLSYGPTVMTKSLLEYAELKDAKLLSQETVKDVKIMQFEWFFPIKAVDLKQYFNESVGDEIMQKLAEKENVYGLHYWNSVAANFTIKIDSNQAFGRIAKQFCPRAYWSCTEYF